MQFFGIQGIKRKMFLQPKHDRQKDNTPPALVQQPNVVTLPVRQLKLYGRSGPRVIRFELKWIGSPLWSWMQTKSCEISERRF